MMFLLSGSSEACSTEARLGLEARCR